MDVRCERCQTEYELEDDSVTEAGTHVQCATCGHTFLVHKDSGAAAGAGAAVEGGPPAADWLLETADGQFHRFRNLTSLQKWIIERKVTRQDKISKTGHAWRRLGEIIELAPFFDVVDEADRAKAVAAQAAAQDLKAEAELARRAGPRTSPALGLPVSAGDSGPRRGTPRSGSPVTGRSAEIPPLEGRPVAVADVPTAVVRLRDGQGWWKMIVGLGVAGVVAYVGITRFWPLGPVESSVGAQAPVAISPGTASPPTPPPTPAEVVPPAPTPPPVNAPSAALPTAAVSAPASDPAFAGSPGSGQAAPGAPVDGVARRTPPDPARTAPARPPASGDEGKSYERLVADGDKALENGAPARAMKLYDRALMGRPNGAEAITGLGYVNLDRGRTDVAIGYFKRALALAPYAPAIFGLAEAHRAGGDSAQALEHYKRYLAVSPSGPDAPAARRQLKALEDARRPPAGGPPAGGGPPSPASVLQEAAGQ